MIDAGARLSAQISMMNEVLRAFAAVDFTGPPEAPRSPPPATAPTVAAGALTPARGEDRIATLPPVEARLETGDPEPGRSLDGLRVPTVSAGRPDQAHSRAAGPDEQAPARPGQPAGAAGPAGPTSAGPVFRDRSGPLQAGAVVTVATDPSDEHDRPRVGLAAAAPFPVSPRIASSPAPRPAAVLAAMGSTMAERPAAVAEGLSVAGRAAETETRPPDAARATLRSPSGDVPPRSADAPADADHRRFSAGEPRGEANGPLGEATGPKAGAAPGPPAVVRHASVADIDLRFFADAAAGSAATSGAQDAAAAAALVFNVAMIPGWPPRPPFALPDAEGLLVGLLGSAHLAGDEELAEGLGRQAGVPALAGNVLALLRDLPRARRRRALLGLMALMDTIETIIETVEAELLALSRARRDDGDEDLAEAGSRRRWTA